MPDESRIDLPSTTRSLPIALIRARERLMEPIRKMLAASGLTEQQWRILRVLEEFGPLEATQLADRAALLLPSQTRIVQGMEAKGYLRRARDSADRRKLTLTITPEGRAILEANAAEARRIADRVEERIGRERIRDLLDLLAELEKL